MELPEFATSPVFWIKFVPVFAFLVLLPVWSGMLSITSDWGFFDKILLSLAGAVGVVLALNGKALGNNRRR